MPEELPDINLLPKYERQSSSTFYLIIAMLIIILVSFILLGFYYFSIKNKVQTAEAEYEEISLKVEELEAQVQQLEVGGTSTLDQAVGFIENHNIPTSMFITELNDLLPEHSYLSEYEYANQVAKVFAHFEQLDTVANYTTELTTSDYMLDTKVDKVETFGLKEEIPEEDIVNFNVIPRYEAEFTLNINKQKLKGESAEDE